MENSEIKCTMNEIRKIKETFEKNSVELLGYIEKYNNEIGEMSKVLSTPNSNKIFPIYLDYFKDKKKYIEENNNHFNDIFETIINSYQNFMEDTSASINGGENE